MPLTMSSPTPTQVPRWPDRGAGGGEGRGGAVHHPHRHQPPRLHLEAEPDCSKNERLQVFTKRHGRNASIFQFTRLLQRERPKPWTYYTALFWVEVMTARFTNAANPLADGACGSLQQAGKIPPRAAPSEGGPCQQGSPSLPSNQALCQGELSFFVLFFGNKRFNCWLIFRS